MDKKRIKIEILIPTYFLKFNRLLPKQEENSDEQTSK